MTLEVLSIGNELLSGYTVNRNAAIIGQALLPYGFSIDKMTVLPDQPCLLKKGVEEAMNRSSFIIMTGGLGPTGDDLTRNIIAEIFKTSLIRNDNIAEELVRRFGKDLSTLENQSMVPKGAVIIPNPLGTASGFILEGQSTLFILPGVPAQMEAMLPPVITYLEKHLSKSYYIKSLYLSLLSEWQVDPFLRILEKEHPGVEIGICPGYGTLSVYVKGKDSKKLACIRDQVAEKFESYVYSTTNKQVEGALHKWMIENRKTFAAAESCTGGHLASRLTKRSGASDYFLGSVVSYSNHLKKTALNVSQKTLKEYGAVSQEVVSEMVKGIKQLTGADYAVAVSGVAGPDRGTDQKPVGLVWSALSVPGKTFFGKIPVERLTRSRTVIIEYTTTYLLASLYRYLIYKNEPYL